MGCTQGIWWQLYAMSWTCHMHYECKYQNVPDWWKSSAHGDPHSISVCLNRAMLSSWSFLLIHWMCKWWGQLACNIAAFSNLLIIVKATLVSKIPTSSSQLLKATVSCLSLFFLAFSSGILERLVQLMSDNISKDFFHCVFIIKKNNLYRIRIKIQANTTRPGAENWYIDHQEITITET